MFKGSRIIRIYQKENKVLSDADKVIKDVIEKNIKTASVLIRATPLMETLTGVMIAGFIAFPELLSLKASLKLIIFSLFLAAMMMAYQPIRSLATLNLSVYQGATAFKRISQIIDKEIKIKEDNYLPQLKIINSEISYDKVFFKYVTSEKQIIENFSIKIRGEQ